MEKDFIMFGGYGKNAYRFKAGCPGLPWDDMPVDVRRQYLFVKQVVVDIMQGKFVYNPSVKDEAVVEIIF